MNAKRAAEETVNFHIIPKFNNIYDLKAYKQ